VVELQLVASAAVFFSPLFRSDRYCQVEAILLSFNWSGKHQAGQHNEAKLQT
jgi:hypothetical protein